MITVEQIGRFLDAVRRWLGNFFKTGRLLVPGLVARRRLEICRGQEGAGCFDSRWHWCRRCQCFLDVKVLFPTEECPRGLWGPWPWWRNLATAPRRWLRRPRTRRVPVKVVEGARWKVPVKTS